MVRQESIMKEIKDFILKSNKELLDKEKARANSELTAIESSIKQLLINIRHEINEESK